MGYIYIIICFELFVYPEGERGFRVCSCEGGNGEGERVF